MYRDSQWCAPGLLKYVPAVAYLPCLGSSYFLTMCAQYFVHLCTVNSKKRFTRFLSMALACCAPPPLPLHFGWLTESNYCGDRKLVTLLSELNIISIMASNGLEGPLGVIMSDPARTAAASNFCKREKHRRVDKTSRLPVSPSVSRFL